MAGSSGASAVIWFQSTLPRGERPRACRTSQGGLAGFNPRSHAGSDSSILATAKAGDVSIHAPTRGATLRPLNNAIKALQFQSTLPRGERRRRRNRDGSRVCVSIHAPTRGATLARGARPEMVCVSIHAPTRGATSAQAEAVPDIEVSIHAPTRGATLNSYQTVRCARCFNPRSHAGSDRRHRRRTIG